MRKLLILLLVMGLGQLFAMEEKGEKKALLSAKPDEVQFRVVGKMPKELEDQLKNSEFAKFCLRCRQGVPIQLIPPSFKKRFYFYVDTRSSELEERRKAFDLLLRGNGAIKKGQIVFLYRNEGLEGGESGAKELVALDDKKTITQEFLGKIRKHEFEEVLGLGFECKHGGLGTLACLSGAGCLLIVICTVIGVTCVAIWFYVLHPDES